MNIYARHGDNVIFENPTYGYSYDQNLAKEHLIIGNIYTVEKTIVHRSSSEVFLVEVPGVSFNTVLFSDITKKKTFKEVGDKYLSIFFSDEDDTDSVDRFRFNECIFKSYLKDNGWTYEEWNKLAIERVRTKLKGSK